MRRATLCVAAAATAAAAAPSLTATVTDLATGAYAVTMGGATWWASAPDPFVFRWDGSVHRPSDGSLTVDSVAPTQGADDLGAYTGWALALGKGRVQATVKNYAALNAVTFETVYPQGLAATNVSGADAAQDFSTAFPVLGDPLAKISTPLGYVAWSGVMCGGSPGAWTSKGLDGGAHFGDHGGVAVVFDESLAAVAISNADNFMVTSIGFPSVTGTAFAAGFNGMLTHIPPGWRSRVLMVGGQGVNDTMYAWGDVLLGLGGKNRTAPDADLVVSKLSYWTDNGAYYYVSCVQ